PEAVKPGVMVDLVFEETEPVETATTLQNVKVLEVDARVVTVQVSPTQAQVLAVVKDKTKLKIVLHENARVETVVIAKGKTQSLKMKPKKTMQTVVSSNDQVPRVEPKPADPATVLLTALAPGVSRLTLTDMDGQEEKLLVAVEDKAGP